MAATANLKPLKEQLPHQESLLHQRSVLIIHHAVLTKCPNDALNWTANTGCIRVMIHPPQYTSYIRFIVTSKIGRHICTVKPDPFGERLVKRRDGRWFLRMMKLR